MDFHMFCNICFYKQNLIKICEEEYETIINILISFIGEQEMLKENKIYLCTKCCETLKHYDKFRNLCVTNLIHFRHIYNQLKKKLEMCNDLDMTAKLSKFVEENVNKRDTETHFDHLKENERICTTDIVSNNEESVTYVFEEGSTNNASKVYIKSEYCDDDESLNNVEYPGIENQEKEMDTYSKDESYVMPIKQEVVDWPSEEEYQDPENINQGREMNAYSKEESSILPTKQEVTDKFSSQEDINPFNEFSTRLKNVDNKLFTEIDLGITGDDLTATQLPRNNIGNINSLKIDSSMVPSKRIAKSSGRTGKAYQCTMCDKSIFGFTSFKRHILVHTGERPHQCSYCERSFTQLGNLKTHIRIHTGEKPHVCNVCNKSFVTSSALKGHKLIHTGERPYVCKLCKRAFSKSTSLKAHEVVHNGAKIHKCNVCEKSFSRVSCLNRHQLVHVEQEIHTCTICNKSFSILAYLKRHLRIHNPPNS